MHAEPIADTSSVASVESTDLVVEDTPVTEAVIQESDVEPEPQWVQPEGNIKSLGAAPAPIEPTPVENPQPQVLDLDELADAAKVMIRNGDPAGALESLRPHLPEAAAEHALSWRVAASAMARLDLTDAAINAFEYATDLDPNEASAWFNKGALKKKMQDIEGAMHCFQTALNLDNQYVKAANGLAMVATDLGKAGVAIDAFRALLSVEPTHASALIFAELLLSLIHI